MKNTKKIIALLLIGSQIGCASEVIHPSLSHARFDPNYSYTIKTNQNVTFPDVPGPTLENQTDRILMQQNGETKYLLHTQVSLIEGESYPRIGSYAGTGALMGAGLGAGVGLVLLISELTSPSEYDPESFCEEGGHECNLTMAAAAGVIFAIIGAGLGAAIPKKSKVVITPTLYPSSNNSMGAGGNVSVRF